jgi:hypothetical protein
MMRKKNVPKEPVNERSIDRERERGEVFELLHMPGRAVFVKLYDF